MITKTVERYHAFSKNGIDYFIYVEDDSKSWREVLENDGL